MKVYRESKGQLLELNADELLKLGLPQYLVEGRRPRLDELTKSQRRALRRAPAKVEPSPPDYDDPFRRPDESIMVWCIHCDEKYLSDGIFWDAKRELWSCPTEGCDGAGFGIDIHHAEEIPL